MKKLHLSLIFIAAVIAWPLMASCGSGQPEKMRPPDADLNWAAEPEAIVLKFQASDDVNLDQGRPSSLSICVYQLSEARVFDQLRGQGQAGLDNLAACGEAGGEEICEELTGLAALAACQKFGDTVLAYDRYFLEPGQKPEPIFLDRREGARFVGLAAGYYHLESDRCARLFPVPIVEVRDGWFSSHREPGQLVVELNFGPDRPEAPPTER
ncbi:MAG: type VI secretion lipoprotein TssJ [Candidatus Adiutrix sp.]|jgi:predicted component of type VI protein secretion system|nr:type VI secretion lipoprotein TssJ [Candidatus Adiutrix sp.]